jgi:hypothetical protein
LLPTSRNKKTRRDKNRDAFQKSRVSFEKSNVPRYALQLESGFRQFDDFIERDRVGDRHIGEHFTVENDVGLLQAANELAVTESAHTDGGVDTNDPQGAEVSFANATVASREHVRAQNGFFHGAQQFAATAAKALRSFKKSFLRSTTRRAFTNSHLSIFLKCKVLVETKNPTNSKARRKLAFGVDVERKSGPKRAGRTDSSRSAFPTRFQKPAFSFDRDVEKKPEKRSTRTVPRRRRSINNRLCRAL